MHKALTRLIVTGMFAFIASAAIAEPLPGKHTMGEIWQKCLTTEGGIATNGSGPGGFGCKTDKGEVSCKKTGTLNGGSVGTCEGCNPSCGMDASGRGTGRRTIDDILSPPSKARPLEPMEASGSTDKPARSVTQSAGDPPLHQMTPQ